MGSGEIPALRNAQCVLLCTTLQQVYDDVDWSHEHVDRHKLTRDMAREALDDPNLVTIRPDPTSKSGQSFRVIGYSLLAQSVLTVVLVDEVEVLYCATAWKSKAREIRLYQGGEES